MVVGILNLKILIIRLRVVGGSVGCLWSVIVSKSAIIVYSNIKHFQAKTLMRVAAALIMMI